MDKTPVREMGEPMTSPQSTDYAFFQRALEDLDALLYMQGNGRRVLLSRMTPEERTSIGEQIKEMIQSGRLDQGDLQLLNLALSDLKKVEGLSSDELAELQKQYSAEVDEFIEDFSARWQAAALVDEGTTDLPDEGTMEVGVTDGPSDSGPEQPSTTKAYQTFMRLLDTPGALEAIDSKTLEALIFKMQPDEIAELKARFSREGQEEWCYLLDGLEESRREADYEAHAIEEFNQLAGDLIQHFEERVAAAVQAHRERGIPVYGTEVDHSADAPPPPAARLEEAAPTATTQEPIPPTPGKSGLKRFLKTLFERIKWGPQRNQGSDVHPPST